MQIWTYEGSNTLSGYLRRRDCLAGIARDLGCPEQVAVSMVMKQILENLQVSSQDYDLSLHEWQTGQA
jgi:hypothetical protein